MASWGKCGGNHHGDLDTWCMSDCWVFGKERWQCLFNKHSDTPSGGLINCYCFMFMRRQFVHNHTILAIKTFSNLFTLRELVKSSPCDNGFKPIYFYSEHVRKQVWNYEIHRKTICFYGFFFVHLTWIEYCDLFRGSIDAKKTLKNTSFSGEFYNSEAIS